MSSGLVEAGKLYGRMVYPTLEFSDQAIIAHGMTPMHVAEKAEAYFREQLARSYAANYWHDESLWQDALRILKKGVESECMRGFSVGLMNAATEEGKMIA